jgi:glyoxylase-like metal-dependent hydrolase (beta-lactamase superfamily II)
MTPKFSEIADRVYVLRHPQLDVTVSLVVGAETAVLVDTLSTPGQAAALATAARAITRLPWIVVNTHHHFDHCFGNMVLAGDPPRPIYAHQRTVDLLRTDPDLVRRRAYEEMLPSYPELAATLWTTEIRAPDHPVGTTTELDLGGRSVVLRYLGRGHTAGDLVVQVPDADVLIVGDLLEESGPPDFAESYPLQWPETVAALLRLTTPATAVVPGHGAVLDVPAARAQHADLTALAWLIREGYGERAVPRQLATRAPFGAAAALPAILRGYAELAGDL